MIFDDISNLKRYQAIPGMEAVLRFLQEHPMDTLTEQRYELSDTMWCTVSRCELREDGPFEVHRRYTDVQLVLEGSERIDWMPLSAQQAPYDFSEQKDVGFFTAHTEEELALRLHPGQFAVFFPEDAHKPLVRMEHDSVKKAVFKLPATQD